MVRRTKSITEVIREAERFLGQKIDITANRGDLAPKPLNKKNKEDKQKIPPIKKEIKKQEPQKQPIQKVQKVQKVQKDQKVQKQKQNDKKVEKQKNIDPIPIKNNKATPDKDLPKIKKAIEKKQVEQQPKQGPRKSKSNLSVESVGAPVGMVDVVFVVDTTGSMDVYLERTTQCVDTLVQRIKEQSKSQDITVRFGFVAYRDHPPQENTYLTQTKQLCSNKEILKYIQTLDCEGGGDGAEAALDGLNSAATEIVWRDSGKIPSLRYIFHICDQPPHGKEFGGYSELWDNGCPCGLTADTIIHRINVRQIHYRLIKASKTNLEKFSNYFKDKIVNYEEVTLEDGSAEGMEIKISDMVIRELLPDVLYE